MCARQAAAIVFPEIDMQPTLWFIGRHSDITEYVPWAGQLLMVKGSTPAGGLQTARWTAGSVAPTLLKLDSLGAKPQPQRLAFRIGFTGLTVNFYSKVVAINIFGTNGVIHGVDTPGRSTSTAQPERARIQTEKGCSCS